MFSYVVHHKDITESTMTDARKSIIAGFGHGTVCSSNHQIKGRGRLPGRRWEDDGSGALLFTLVLKRSSVPTGFPLTQLLALALCKRLENEYGLSPRIKWPNDVLVDGKKIAGILVETEGDFYLAGMGVNILQTGFSGDFRRPAVSLALAMDSSIAGFLPDPGEELAGLLSEIGKLIEKTASLTDLEGRLAGLGNPAVVYLGDPGRGELINGILSGLQPDGALLLRLERGEIKAVYSGEIQEFRL